MAMRRVRDGRSPEPKSQTAMTPSGMRTMTTKGDSTTYAPVKESKTTPAKPAPKRSMSPDADVAVTQPLPRNRR